MILGTGIDIIEIDRIKQAVDRWGEDFLNRIFTEDEIAYAQKHTFPAQHYAARFAVKEAIYKAFSGIIVLTWKDMTILNDLNGKPYCRFNNKDILNTVLISISHSKYYAVANAIVIGD